MKLTSFHTLICIRADCDTHRHVEAESAENSHPAYHRLKVFKEIRNKGGVLLAALPESDSSVPRYLIQLPVPVYITTM